MISIPATTIDPADPSKWRDRVIEFRSNAGSLLPVVCPIGVFGISAFNASLGNFGSAGASMPILLAHVAAMGGSSFTGIAASWNDNTPTRPRPVARRLGMAFPALAGLTAGGIVYAAALNWLPERPQRTAKPEAAFRAVTRTCDDAKAQCERFKVGTFLTNQQSAAAGPR